MNVGRGGGGGGRGTQRNGKEKQITADLLTFTRLFETVKAKTPPHPPLPPAKVDKKGRNRKNNETTWNVF